MLQTGYILNRRDDAIWFIGFPLFATAFALVCHRWLPYVALASITVWITMPHQFATMLRVYGHREDWQRWKLQLTLGPAIIFALALAGVVWLPLTLFLVVMLWDHQHSLMQQHGLARIYDFKAHAGAPSTRHFDLALHWVLYGNLVLTTPLFSVIWIRELYRWHIPISPDIVRYLQIASAVITVGYVLVYVAHVLWSSRRGYTINPLKYAFIVASYFLWYFTAWYTESVLAYGVAHRLMHGVQYIVIVYWFLRRKQPTEGKTQGIAGRLAAAGHAKIFLLACFLYAVVYQILLAQPWEEFGFGLIDFSAVYEAIPEFGLQAMDTNSSYQIFAAIMIDGLTLTHYYLDSFIWKVRDKDVQGGL